MTNYRNRLTRWIAAFVVAMAGISMLAESATKGDQLTKDFHAALRSVDRIVLEGEFDSKTLAGAGQKIIFELAGREKVRTLAIGVAIGETDQPCLCITRPVIKFYCGNDYYFSLTLHHGNRLRCEDGPWFGDAQMDEVSAANFRNWFAQQGFSGFQQQMDEIRRVVDKEAQRRKELTSLFPPPARVAFEGLERMSLGDVEERAQRFGQAFPDRVTMIGSAWRVLGRFADEYFDDHQWWERILRAALNTASEHELIAAIAALKDDSILEWKGLFEHYSGESDGAIVRVMETDGHFSRALRKAIMTRKPPYIAGIVRDLARREASFTNDLLFDIARDPRLSGEAAEISFLDSKRASPAEAAVLILAQRRFDPVRAIIEEKFAGATTAEQRVTYTVAMAHFDDSIRLDETHLGSDVEEVATATWKLMSTKQGFVPSIDLLLVAARSSAYQVQRAGEVGLRARGLSLASPAERAAIVVEQFDAEQLRTTEGLARLLEQQALRPHTDKKVQEAIISQLSLKKAELRAQAGDYAGAIEELERGRVGKAGAALAAQVNLAMGRYSDSVSGLMQSVGRDLEKSSARYLANRAFWAFGRGDYESAAADFDAAGRLDALKVELPLIFRHLALLQLNREAESGVSRWSPWDVLDLDPDPRTYWPQSGIKFLQGNYTEAAMIESVERHERPSSDDRAEAYFMLAVLRRKSGQIEDEKLWLSRTVEMKAYLNPVHALALGRMRELARADMATK